MASTLPNADTQTLFDDARASESPTIWESIHPILAALASLKITVALFGISIFLVLAGTLAQTEMDIWDVVHSYFRSPIAWIRPGVFFPESFFPGGFGDAMRRIPISFPYPGGWLIGACMVVNLIAAHTVRFKVQARGTRLQVGVVILFFGGLVTWLVIASGANKDGLQGAAWIPYSTLWLLFKIGIAGLFAASLYFTAVLWRDPAAPAWAKKLALPVPILLGGLVIWLLTAGADFALDSSAMRILWQLIKGTIAGLVLLAGCILVFHKRAGIVLLHGGVGLMMFSEVLVGLTAVEGQMQITEGENTNFGQDIRDYELAVIDSSDEEKDHVTVVPASLLRNNVGEIIQDDQLPFDIRVDAYYANSRLRKAQADDNNPADTGAGKEWFAEEAKRVAGTDNNGGVDQPAAYLTLFKKGTQEKLGVYLVSLAIGAEGMTEPVAVDSRNYGVALRFKREYKPYSLTLIDVRKDDYQGTNTPRNYSSDVILVDESRDTNRHVRIWMNNPLRFAGETFYQSNYFKNMRTGQETTTLSVVTNTGWMIPYVSCMIVAVGMLFQFGVTLLRFLNRRSNTLAAASGLGDSAESAPTGGRRDHRRPKTHSHASALDLEPAPHRRNTASIALSLAVVIIFGGYALSKARVPRAKSGEMKLYEFSQIPVVYEGRTKPIDTIARNALLILSNKQTWTDENGNRQPAVAWMLDVIARPERSFKHKVVRIENLELQEWLGLKKREGFRYSVSEFMEKLPELDKIANEARQLGQDRPTELSTFQRKAIELQTKMRQMITIRRAFDDSLPDQVKQVLNAPIVKSNPEMQKRFRQAFTEELYRFGAPRAVPPTAGSEWDVYAAAGYDHFANPNQANPGYLALQKIFSAYAAGDAQNFNAALTEYQTRLAQNPPEELNQAKVRFESFFNHFAPFWYSAALYLVAFVLAALALLGWSAPLNRASFWLIAVTLCLHTFALVGRMYISGRPPVTNLYSSAVFIGWGCVALGMVLELVYRLGIGNMLAAVSGFLTLGIAHFLAGDGDTFTVLQAVLDTQFWLATHVVCITLGYSTTFVAGILGLIYLIQYNRFGLLALAASLAPASIVLMNANAFDYSREVGSVVGLAAAACFAYWLWSFLGVQSSQPAADHERAKSIPRMIYGTLCFAIFFSFVGTVLGGLWADDSWGRFWGWDPKENGALIIVLWNALVLHARWGAMVKDRGMAVLSIAGNICTAWSWFGVNELGVGLHSYGFTDGVLLALGLFVVSQGLFILAGSVSDRLWTNTHQAPAS